MTHNNRATRALRSADMGGPFRWVLRSEQRKLLQLHYAGEISSALFADEERRLAAQIEVLVEADSAQAIEEQQALDLATEFDQVVDYLETVDIETLWGSASETERRTLLNELLDQIEVHEDQLVVKVHGAPPLNMTFEETGLVRAGEFPSCRRAEETDIHWRLRPWAAAS